MKTLLKCRGRNRAAYFLSDPEHLGRPFDEAIFLALRRLGYQVDVFTTATPKSCDHAFIDRFDLGLKTFDYGARWLGKRFFDSSWKDYDVYLSCCSAPVPTAYLLSRRSRAKFVIACDEIYAGRIPPDPRFEWLAKYAMRKADLTIITDLCRMPLQCDYAGLREGQQPFLENCCACVDPRRLRQDKRSLRTQYGIPADMILISYAGTFHEAGGAGDFLSILDFVDTSRVGLMIQTAGTMTDLVKQLLDRLSGYIPLWVFDKRTTYQQALSVTAMADIGFVVYTQAAPQFSLMGFSSQKLCNYLYLGQPVIALRQPSFQILEDQGMAVLYDTKEQLPTCVQGLIEHIEEYRANVEERYDRVIPPESERMRRLLAGLRPILLD
ncbi:hypothetical protein [uncultured Thiodictyon sp.]|uniref:hypothetical protein n=1 Tax=uncultured Thiodictyon sp. TaxID=1846217 RepID=UPI0025E7298E|nr:hypothetical protein [uncultured Thiodictyon sp.]